MMASRMTRMLLVVTALTLAVGASGVTGGIGPHGITVAAQSNDRGSVSAPVGDPEDSASMYVGAPGYAYADYALAGTGGTATAD